MSKFKNMAAAAKRRKTLTRTLLSKVTGPVHLLRGETARLGRPNLKRMARTIEQQQATATRQTEADEERLTLSRPDRFE